MLQLSIVSGFVRALGAFASFAPKASQARVVEYSDKVANLIDLAATGQQAVAAAEQKMLADSQTMQLWVDSGYEPSDAEFDQLESEIDELHERYQAAKATSG